MTPPDDLMPIESDAHVLTAADYERARKSILLPSDGYGCWATKTHYSWLETHKPRPEWATHVVWFNK